MGEEKKVYRVLVRKPEGKRPLRRSRRRWEDGIRMDVREMGWESVEWIRLAQNSNRWGFCEYADETSGSDATELVS
jgi:hypothetical protein